MNLLASRPPAGQTFPGCLSWCLGRQTGLNLSDLTEREQACWRTPDTFPQPVSGQCKLAALPRTATAEGLRQGGQWSPGPCQTESALLIVWCSLCGEVSGGLHVCSMYHHQVPLGIVSGQVSKHVHGHLPRDTPQPVNSMGPMSVASGISLGILNRALT